MDEGGVFSATGGKDMLLVDLNQTAHLFLEKHHIAKSMQIPHPNHLVQVLQAHPLLTGT